MNVQISARAQSDLESIYVWLSARQGPRAADEFLDLAQEAAGFLGQHPLAGPHPRWATRHRALRFWVISKTSFLIYYFPDERGVSIERVLDGRRDVARIIELARENPSG
jgi:plasmid stabilization system protein ParE